MKIVMKHAFIGITLLVLTAFSWGQSRGSAPSSSGSGDSSRGSVSSSNVSSGSVSSSSSSSRDFSGSSGYGGGSTSSYSLPYINLSGTSWTSYDSYYQWSRYRDYLLSHYFLSGSYFTRFRRNFEPLATPELVKLTFRRPLKLSLQMLDAIDELEAMLQSEQNGKPVDKQAVTAKLQEIRDLNKQIRNDQGLEIFDQRRDKDAEHISGVDKLDLDAIAKLRELVTGLSTQLKNSYSQTTPSVVSVSSLSQPSFTSMCKEIEKVTKSLEGSARRL